MFSGQLAHSRFHLVTEWLKCFSEYLAILNKKTKHKKTLVEFIVDITQNICTLFGFITK